MYLLNFFKLVFPTLVHKKMLKLERIYELISKTFNFLMIQKSIFNYHTKIGNFYYHVIFFGLRKAQVSFLLLKKIEYFIFFFTNYI
jgi:hypothetical protein